MDTRVTQSTDSLGQPLRWATTLSDPATVAKGYEAALRWRETGDAQAGIAFIGSEIASAKTIGKHLIDNHLVSRDKPVPIVWIPDGGVLAQKGLSEAFAEAGLKTLIVPCAGYEKRRRHAVPREALEAAKACGQIIIADGVVKTGDSVNSLLGSLHDFDGKIIIAANRTYREEALTEGPHQFFRGVVEGKNLPDHMKPKDIALYTADVVDKAHDPVDVADAVLQLHDKTPDLAWAKELLLKRNAVGLTR